MENNGKVIDFNKIIKDKEMNECKDLTTWDWEDFKTAWEAINSISGEDIAWQAIFEMWEIRSRVSDV